jgi:hypothetical protein
VGFHIRRRLGIFIREADLALAFGDDRELHAEGVHDGIDGFEAWVGACA